MVSGVSCRVVWWCCVCAAAAPVRGVAASAPPSRANDDGVATGGDEVLGIGSLSASCAKVSATSNPMPPAPMTATRFVCVCLRSREHVCVDTTDGWSLPSMRRLRGVTPVASTTASHPEVEKVGVDARVCSCRLTVDAESSLAK